jgi:hypothetical protein
MYSINVTTKDKRPVLPPDIMRFPKTNKKYRIKPILNIDLFSKENLLKTNKDVKAKNILYDK